MLSEYTHVRIKYSGITGVIVDVPRLDTDRYYTVEADERGTAGGYGKENQFKLYDCLEEDLEVIDSG